jgi:hypothetical protein
MPSPSTTDAPGLLDRCFAELKRLVVLAAVVGLLVIAGKYYCFDRLDEEIRQRAERLLREHYQGLAVTVKSARRVAGQGIEIRGVRIAEAGGNNAAVLAEIDEVFAVCDTRLPDFLTGRPKFSELHLRRLKLRAQRKPSGLWNLSHLFPLPSSPNSMPRATISDAALEIVDPTQQPACSWTLRNIELTVAPQVESQGITLHIRGTLAGDHLERVEIDGSLEPASEQWDIRGAVEGLEFSPRLRAALPRELSTALAPLSSIRGRTYFGFHAQRGESHLTRPKREGTGLPITFTVHGKIAEGRIDDARLPEPLTDVEATIRVDNHRVRIENLSARCGATQIELDATLAGYGSGPIDVESLNVRHLQLERWPLASLPPQLRETWDRFSPRGVVDLAGSLRFDGHTWQPNLIMQCHDLSLLYDRFPYHVSDGSGQIVLKPDFASVRLKTLGGGRVIHCQAEVRNPGRDFTGWFDIQTDGPIPIDDKLLAALDPAAQKLVRSFAPRGSASVQAHFQRDPGNVRLHRTVNVQLHDCSIQHERFRYPIDKVTGLLELTDDRWLFRNLAGRNDSAYIGGSGSFDMSPHNKELVLAFTAADVPLAEELRQALPPGVGRLWTNLRPRGNIDYLKVGLHYSSAQRGPSGEPGRWSIDVQAEKQPVRPETDARPISLEPAWFRYRLDNVSGRFHYRDGQMQIADVHAIHGQASVSAAGECRLQPDGSCRLLTTLSADRVQVDQDLRAAMPTGLAQSLDRFPLEGPLNLQGHLGLTVAPQADVPPLLDWDVSLEVARGRLATPTPLECLCGGMRLWGRKTPEGIFSRGELSFDSLVVRGVQLANLSGPFFFDGHKLVFGARAERDAQGRAPRQVRAAVLGGTLSLDGEIGLAEEGPFQVQASLDNADLAEIARTIAPQLPPVSGRLYGLANIHGTAQGKHTWRGDGQVRLRDADIYRLPLMIRLLSILSIKPPDRTAFTTSDIAFQIEGDDLALTRIDFSGDAISLKGKGVITSQRQIDLKFYPVVGREEAHLPLLRPLFGQTGREFMLIEVTGTLDRTDLRSTMLPRLDERLQRIFPELVRFEPDEPAAPVPSLPREALNRLWTLPPR